MKNWRNLASMNIFIFVISIGEGMVGPAIPLYAKQLGASYSNTGMIMTGYSVAYVMMTLLAGFLSDYFDRKRILLLSPVLSIIAAVGYSLASTPMSLLLFRSVEGMSRGILWPLAEAIISDNTIVEGRGLAAAKFTAAYALGVAVGNLAGGFVMQYEGLAGVFPFYPVFGSLALIAVMYGVSGRRPMLNWRDKSSKVFVSIAALEIRKIWPVCFVGFAYGGFLFSLWGLLSVMASYYNVSFMGVGIIFTFMWFSRLISIAVAGNTGITSRKRVLVGAIVLATVSAAMLMVVQKFVFLVVAVVLGGLGTGVMFPVSITLNADLASKEYRGFDMGLMELSEGLGMIFETALSSLVGQANGVQMTYFVSFITFVIVLITTVRYLRDPRSQNVVGVNV